jgi:hypothetical protein
VVPYLLSLCFAGELQRVPKTLTRSLNGTETVVPVEGWMVVDDEGRIIGPAEFALAVGDDETTALLATVQARRDRAGRSLMVVGGVAAAGGIGSVVAGSQTASPLLVQGGMLGGLGGFVLVSVGRRLTRSLHPDINELDEVYTAEQVDAWLAS